MPCCLMTVKCAVILIVIATANIFESESIVWYCIACVVETESETGVARIVVLYDCIVLHVLLKLKVKLE